jgi:multiple sugar transport system substrate-binding protein
MIKRRWLFVLLLVLLLPIIAACGDETATSAPTTAPATGGTTATTAPSTGGDTPTTAPSTGAAGEDYNYKALAVEDGATLTLVAKGNPAGRKIYEASFESYNQGVANVKVTFEAVAADYPVKIKADAAGGTLGDVFFIDSGLFNALAPNDILLDLTPYMAQVGMKPEDFAGPLITIFQLDGKTYGLPKDFGGLAVHVNNRLAKEAGVTIPADGEWTWDDFKAAAQKLTKGEGNDKIYGTCTPPDIDRAGAFVFANGGKVLSDDGTKAVYNEPAAVEAITWWHSLYKDGLGAVPKEIGQDWCGAAFGNEKTAMVVEGGWMFNYMKQSFPAVEYTTVPMPKSPKTGQRATLLFTNAWAASAETKFPNAAAALVTFLVGKTNQQTIAETGFALPSLAALTNLPYYETDKKSGVIAKSAEYGHLAVYGPKNDDFRKPLLDAMEKIWLGSADIQSTLDDAAKQSTDAIK